MEIIDYFRDFRTYYNNKATVEELIDIWLNYTNNKLQLREMCINDYKDSGYDWKEVAKTHVFCFTHTLFSKMEVAYSNLLKIVEDTTKEIDRFLNKMLDINIVIYHGLGNGAGWATEYNNKYAVLFGIEKIAELNWESIDKLEALISHEITHIIHFYLRGKDEINSKLEQDLHTKGIWQLYIEGFAQYYQNVILNKQVESRGINWLKQCSDVLPQLKRMYLEALYDDKRGCKEFFGDWFKILGISDTGYFLGQLFISDMAKKYSFEQIALLDEKILKQEILAFLKN